MQTVHVLADKCSSRILIGKQGENEAVAVKFNVTKWLEMWPGATVTLAVANSHGDAYPVTVETENGITTWIVSNSDTAYAGDGKCELRIIKGNVIKKSATFPTYVVESFTASGEAPDPMQDWLDGRDANNIKTAVSGVFTQLKTLIQDLAFTSSSHNGAATVSAIETAISILDGDTPVVTTYTITKSLTNCSISNNASSITDGSSYSATISVNSGYTLSAVTVTMGGNNITSSAYNSQTRQISIASVTGNVSITASAAQITYTVTNTLSNCASSNAAVSATHGSSYSATLSANSGYTLGTVTVIMGGTNITATAYNSATGAVSIPSVTGNIAITGTATASAQATVYTVTNTLTHCTNSNSAVSAAENAAYSGTLSADTGYTLGTVTVTMGGVDITSSAYSNGAISIAAVTGNIVITASAVVNTVTLSSISAVFSQGNNTVYDSTALNDLKQYLTVTATYSDSSTAVISAANYTLSGTLSVGTSTITVSYGGKTSSFTVTVTQTPPTLSSISAVLDLNGASIYTNNSVNDLKQYLTVTATYSDSSTAAVSADNYTLSGTLNRGTQTITVTHEGKTATFTVFVNTALPSGYTELTYIATDGSQYVDPQIVSGAVRHAEYEIMVTALNSDDTSLSSSDQSYKKGNHIFSGRNSYFPYFTGNSDGWQTTLYGNHRGSQTPSGENETNLFAWNLNQRYVLSGFANNELKVDGTTQYHLDVGGSAYGETMIFFGYGYESNKRKYRFRGRLYYAKLYDNNHVLIHDYVPCKNGSNVVGLYDLVGETFISSATSSALIAGEVA